MPKGIDTLTIGGMKLPKPKLFLFASLLFLNGCTILHKTQIGEIDSKAISQGQRFEVLLSETGVNLKEAAQIARAFTNSSQTSSQIKEVEEFISYFQMGPRTGNMVFNDRYADAVPKILLAKCPSGRISNLMCVRETAKYPVVSGEIIKIIGYCLN